MKKVVGDLKSGRSDQENNLTVGSTLTTGHLPCSTQSLLMVQIMMTGRQRWLTIGVVGFLATLLLLNSTIRKNPPLEIPQPHVQWRDEGEYVGLGWTGGGEEREVGVKSSEKKHPMFRIPSWSKAGDGCAVNEALWDCVGDDRDWGLVFVDHRPGENRVRAVERLAQHAEIVIVHDTQQPSYGWPSDWEQSKNSQNPIWGGRSAFVDKEGRENAWTTAVQGDLDPSGEFFANMRKIWHSDEARTASASLNPDHGEFGTHTRLLWAAAKASQGDILEMGTGAFSTPMLHNLTGETGRNLVSAETDSGWLSKFQDQGLGHHQLLLVPVYGDGAGCFGNNDGVPPSEDLTWAGIPSPKLSNKEVACPKIS